MKDATNEFPIKCGYTSDKYEIRVQVLETKKNYIIFNNRQKNIEKEREIAMKKRKMKIIEKEAERERERENES